MPLLGLPAFANGIGKGHVGAVFVGTNHNNTMDHNQPPNQIALYMRETDGSLTLRGYYNTGGQGSGPSKRFAGDGLGAAHSVQLSQNRKWLFVTNAGSNNLSVFRVKLDFGPAFRNFMNNGLELTDLEPTGDGSPNHRFPNSVTQSGNLVYVLNSADQGSITGFTFTENGKLKPIPNSTRLLNANQTYPPDTLYNPVQVSFTPDGRRLMVTIKDGPASGAIPGVTPTGPGRVLVFDVDARGVPSATYRQTNLDNHGPFGFSFDRHGDPLIALFVGGPVGTAAAGSFRIAHDGSLAGITPDVADTQLDTCWLENNGRFAYGANYSSGTISSFMISEDGHLALLAAAAGTTEHGGNVQGSTPLDLRVSPNGDFLYDVLPGTGKVAAWRINDDGSLTGIGEYPGLPQTVNGDMAPQERFGPGGSPAGIDVI
jgi:6-phosphogluconolactonase (cycloisomerase 2 family)